MWSQRIYDLDLFCIKAKTRAEVGYNRGHIIKVQVILRHSRG